MSEDALWRYVRGKLLPPGTHATRIESRVSPGFPDVHYVYRGQSGTLELKFLRKKKPPFGDEGLNLEQRIWHREADSAGATAYLIAEITPRIYIIKGSSAEVFNEWTQEDFDLHSKLVLTKRRVDKEDRSFFIGLLEKKYA